MKIAYVRNTFPKATETFILEEIIYLKKSHHQIRIFAKWCELSNLNNKIMENRLLDVVVYTDISTLPFIRKLRMIRAFLQKKKIKGYTDSFKKDYFPYRNLSSEIEKSINSKPVFLRPFSRLSAAWNIWIMAMRLNNMSLARNQFLLRQQDFVPDHVHTPFLFFGDATKLCGLLASSNATYTVTLRSRDIYLEDADEEYLKLRDDLIESADKVFTISEYNKRQFASKFSLPQQMEVIHSSIDTHFFEPNPLAVKKNNKLICVARLVPKKGLELLIDACDSLHRQGVAFHLSIVGSGGLKKTLLERIRVLGLRDKVEIIGPFKPEIIRYLLDESELFVLPCVVAEDGDRDMLPNSLKEAMSMKLVTITTNISGIDELINNGVTGWLTKPNCADDLAEKIAFALQNKAAGAAMGDSARKKIVDDFSILGEGRKFVEALEKVQAERTTRPQSRPQLAPLPHLVEDEA